MYKESRTTVDNSVKVIINRNEADLYILYMYICKCCKKRC